MQRGGFQSTSWMSLIALALASPSGARADVFDMDLPSARGGANRDIFTPEQRETSAL